MKINEFKKAKKRLSKILEAVEQKAIEDGFISSPDFDKGVEIIKERTLQKWNIDPDDYRETERIVSGNPSEAESMSRIEEKTKDIERTRSDIEKKLFEKFNIQVEERIRSAKEEFEEKIQSQERVINNNYNVDMSSILDTMEKKINDRGDCIEAVLMTRQAKSQMEETLDMMPKDYPDRASFEKSLENIQKIEALLEGGQMKEAIELAEKLEKNEKSNGITENN